MSSPLSFHADPKKVGYILYQGTKCESVSIFFRSCHDEVRPATLDAYSLINSHGTTHDRHTIPKKRSEIHPRRCSTRLQNASLRTRQRSSNMTLHPTSYSVSHGRRKAKMDRTLLSLPGCSLPQTTLGKTGRSLTSVLGHASVAESSLWVS